MEILIEKNKIQGTIKNMHYALKYDDLAHFEDASQIKDVLIMTYDKIMLEKFSERDIY